MWNKIVNPATGRRVSVYGKTGKKVLQNYLIYLRYIGGSNKESSDSNTEGVSILEFQEFLTNLNLDDEYINELYAEFKLYNDEPLPLVEKYLEQSNEWWSKGKYYLGGQVPLDKNHKITFETIKQVKDINAKLASSYGEPDNSAEAYSIYRSVNELKIIENLLIFYEQIQEHLKYKPGGVGALEAQQDF